MTTKSSVHLFMCSLPLCGLLVSQARAADLGVPHAVAIPADVPAPSPFDLNVTFTGEAWRNNGGVKTGSDFIYGLDASLNVDLQKIAGLKDARVYLEGFYVGGKAFDSNYTGAVQGPSALDAFSATNSLKLYQAYYEQQFGSTSILVGKYDVQTQFATTRPMDVFGNKAEAMPLAFFLAGIGTGLNDASTYPNTSVGLRIKQTLSDQWAVKVALLDGEADLPTGKTGILINSDYGALGIGEVDYTPSTHTKLMVGVWGETGKLSKIGQFSPSFAQLYTRGEVGEYIGGATRLYTIEGSRGVDAFFNVAFAPQATSTVNHSYDAGVTVTGLFGSRPHDKLGIAASVAQNSPGYKALEMLAGNQLATYETAYELTYRAKVTDWLVLQPEIQYIVHPSLLKTPGLGVVKNAFVFGLHFELHRQFN